MSEINGGTVERHGSVMHELGEIRATLASHIADESADVGRIGGNLKDIDARLKRLEELLTAGHAVTRAAAFVLPLILALVAGVWAAHDWWNSLFRHAPPPSHPL